MIVDINPQERPLCPNNGSPQHPAHKLHNELIDIVSANTEHDEDFEVVQPESDKINAAVAYGRFDGRMYLYKDSVSYIQGRTFMLVEAWYFRCNLCGLILPATATKDQR
jgi:hypothetical protein